MFTARKPKTVKTIVMREVGFRRPTPEDVRDALENFEDRGGLLHQFDGRAYAPFKRATPLLPGGVHGRWEKGKVVPRKRA